MLQKIISLFKTSNSVALKEPKASKQRKKRKKKQKYTFRVTGVTKKNCENKDIQKLIKSIVKEELECSDKYQGLTNKEIRDYYYDENIYQSDIYETSGITLIPEPSNPFDSNAIKVVHYSMGHIGYVPKKNIIKVAKILNDDYKISWSIIGGKFKYVNHNDEVKTKTHTYGVEIELIYKDTINK